MLVLGPNQVRHITEGQNTLLEKENSNFGGQVSAPPNIYAVDSACCHCPPHFVDLATALVFSTLCCAPREIVRVAGICV